MGTENDIPLVGANVDDGEDEYTFLDHLGRFCMRFFIRPVVESYKFMAGW